MSMATAHSVFRGGFADPVFDAQAVFRQVMNALARPGTVNTIEAVAKPPEPLSPLIGAIAATLFDGDTGIWLDPQLARRNDVIGWLTFHTAAPIVDQGFDARFALVGDGALLPSLESFAQGTQEYPDRSTTIILQMEGFFGGAPLILTGPGIRDSQVIEPIGLPPHFCDQWAGNNSRYPRGVDVILAAPDGIIGLPRTTRIKRRNGRGG